MVDEFSALCIAMLVEAFALALYFSTTNLKDKTVETRLNIIYLAVSSFLQIISDLYLIFIEDQIKIGSTLLISWILMLLLIPIAFRQTRELLQLDYSIPMTAVERKRLLKRNKYKVAGLWLFGAIILTSSFFVLIRIF